MTDRLNDDYDVVVIGGGAAGLSGALMLGRARRSVAVIDAGAPRNAPADGVHGLLALDGIRPAELLERGRADVRRYGGHLVSGEVSAVTGENGSFTVALTDGRSVRARRLLVTTGLVDELPDVPGLRARWGHDVLHCPYCHGWEVRDQRIGVLAGGPMSVHQALLFRQWSADIAFFTHTTPPPAGEQAEQLAARGIRVIDGKVTSLRVVDDRLTGVRLSDGTEIDRDALAVPPRMVARAGFLATLGLHPVEHPSGMGEHIPCDATGRTDAPGVWVAGNITELSAQVAAAAAAGASAAGQINADLVDEETREAVAAYRDPMTEEFGRSFWEERYSGHATTWSARPNPQLVAEAADLAPGAALDAGCGKGADAVWLASRGWQVTAVDIATTALSHARRQAEALGSDIAEKIEWVPADLDTWTPSKEQYDLVTTHYVHTRGSYAALVRRLAAAVAPGGTLLVVSHHPSDQTTGSYAATPGVHLTADEVAANLDRGRWEIAVAETRTRSATGHGDHACHEITIRDAVLRARKRP